MTLLINYNLKAVHTPQRQMPMSLMKKFFEQARDAELFDPQISEDHNGLLGMYHELWNEDRVTASHMWFVHRRSNMSEWVGIAAISSQSPRRLQLFVHPCHRHLGIGSWLVLMAKETNVELSAHYTADSMKLFSRYNIPPS